jgi:hypothetical protein
MVLSNPCGRVNPAANLRHVLGANYDQVESDDNEGGPPVV